MTAQERKYLDRLARVSGLSWRGLASRLGVNERGRPGLRPTAGPGRPLLVGLARELPGGCDSATGDDHNGQGG